MRILLVNTADHAGGAAIAALRLLDALNHNGVKAQLLVAEKTTDNMNVIALPRPRLWRRFVWAYERLRVYMANGCNKQRLFDVSPANIGFDITNLPVFKEADVIHLHWINQGFLSLRTIRKILKTGKPVVWTMHDMWTYTGICQIAPDCNLWQTHCGACPKLTHGQVKDLSYRVFEKKIKLYNEASKLSFVGCSKWMMTNALQSTLLGGQNIWHIPNPLNTTQYAPQNMQSARTRLRLPQDKFLLLFTAFRITNVFKGFDYLRRALDILALTQPAQHARLAVVTVGKEAHMVKDTLNVPLYPFDYETDEQRMVGYYNACDAFIIPTLMDNLPNTIAEAMACGKPVVGFNVGGVPEMIDHLKNGYLAQYKDAEDLAQGITTIFDAYAYPGLSKEARKKALSAYSEYAVSMKMIQLYNTITRTENA